MCGIAGIVSDNDNYDIGNTLKKMLQSMQHRGPDGAGYVIGGLAERGMSLEDLKFEGRRGRTALGHVRLAITGGIAGLQPFQSADGRLCLLHNGEIYNYRKLRAELEGTYTFQTQTDSEVILALLEKAYRGDLSAAVEEVLPRLDGVYALAVNDQNSTVIARDRIGVRQLYFSENNGDAAFASEKKPLYAIFSAGQEIQRLLPGHIATLDGKGVRTRSFWSPESLRTEDRITDKKEALRRYDRAISRSIYKRVAGRDRVGIIFSGGIDSLLIAHLVRRKKVPLTCYTAGRKGAVDLVWAQNIADRFDLPLKIKILSLEEIKELIPLIIRDIEDYSLNQVEVAIPIYASVRMAQESGERVILTGQGADELFGGYSWYPKIVDREGYESFERYSWEDTTLLYKECLEREDKIAMAHSLELRVPFLDPEVIEVAFKISPELKINKGDDSIGKQIHREYSISVGIPADIAYRKKEAAQHGADVHSALEEIAAGLGVTDTMLEKSGYDPEKSTVEKLGSSSRYGFRYGEQHLWKPRADVQLYLDSHAASLGLMSPEQRANWLEVTTKLDAMFGDVSPGRNVR